MAPLEIEGNTISISPAKRLNSAKRWCFTWNNYPEDYDELLGSKLTGCKFIYGKEVGKSGTPHLQGYLELDNKNRPSNFGLPKQIHWEVAKGNREANIKYCTKDGDYYGNFQVEKPLKLLTVEQLYDWQKGIYDILKCDPSDRTIYWVWEAVGNRGKSAFVKFCLSHFGGIICAGKAADIKYLIVKYKETHGIYPRYIFYDVSRKMKNFVCWNVLEEIKNGCFSSTKYECEMVLMNSPHIFCFANFEPDYDMVSGDRLNVIALG